MSFPRIRVIRYVEEKFEMLKIKVERALRKEQHKFDLSTLLHIGNYSRFLIQRYPFIIQQQLDLFYFEHCSRRRFVYEQIISPATDMIEKLRTLIALCVKVSSILWLGLVDPTQTRVYPISYLNIYTLF